MRNTRLARLGIFVAMGAGLAACEKIPGTDAYKLKIAKEVAARELIDPSSAQFRDLKVRGDVVCGEINAKNRMGAYVGFKRFYSDTKAKTSSIDPEFDIGELLSAADFCSSVRSNSYSSYSLIQSACEREAEQRLTQIAQTLFDSGWARHCEGSPPPAASKEKAAATGAVDNALEAADALSNDADAAANLTMDSALLSNDMDEQLSPQLVDENGEPVGDSSGEPRGVYIDEVIPRRPAVGAAPVGAASEKSEPDRIFGHQPRPQGKPTPKAPPEPPRDPLADPLQPRPGSP